MDISQKLKQFYHVINGLINLLLNKKMVTTEELLEHGIKLKSLEPPSPRSQNWRTEQNPGKPEEPTTEGEAITKP
jgi:hypothetical protein